MITKQALLCRADNGHFDLPIALGILIASGQVAAGGLEALEFAGELSLSGELRPIRGALSMALSAAQAGRALVVPRGARGRRP